MLLRSTNSGSTRWKQKLEEQGNHATELVNNVETKIFLIRVVARKKFVGFFILGFSLIFGVFFMHFRLLEQEQIHWKEGV